MRARLNRAVVWAAIFGIALQTILAAFAAPLSPVQAAFDPYTVICHSETQNSDASPAGSQPAAPVQCSDHCVLCNASVVANTPDAATPISLPVAQRNFLPDLAATPRPVSSVADPNLARGPPHVA